jgi:hypothetical protein
MRCVEGDVVFHGLLMAHMHAEQRTVLSGHEDQHSGRRELTYSLPLWCEVHLHRAFRGSRARR